MLRKLMAFGLVFALAGALAACGKSASDAPAVSGSPSAGAGSPTPAASSTTSASKPDPEALAKANCVQCHGVDLKGQIGPSLQKIGAKLSRDQIRNQIANGGGGMPAMKSKLKPEDIDALADWLAAKK